MFTVLDFDTVFDRSRAFNSFLFIVCGLVGALNPSSASDTKMVPSSESNIMEPASS